jgi:hypothetical protein
MLHFVGLRNALSISVQSGNGQNRHPVPPVARALLPPLPFTQYLVSLDPQWLISFQWACPRASIRPPQFSSKFTLQPPLSAAVHSPDSLLSEANHLPFTSRPSQKAPPSPTPILLPLLFPADFPQVPRSVSNLLHPHTLSCRLPPQQAGDALSFGGY